MDRFFLLRLEKVLSSIKRKLLLNEKIRTLLFYDSKDLMDGVDIPEIEMVSENIFLQPVISVDVEPPFNKKTFIAITPSASGFSDSSELTADHAIKISIMTHKSNWIFGNNKIRLLHLAQEIINELDNNKMACSGRLLYEQMLQTVIDDSITGFSLLFSITDGLGIPEDEKDDYSF